MKITSSKRIENTSFQTYHRHKISIVEHKQQFNNDSYEYNVHFEHYI